MLRIVSHVSEAATHWGSLLVHTCWIAIAHIYLTALPMVKQDFCYMHALYIHIHMWMLTLCLFTNSILASPSARSLSVSSSSLYVTFYFSCTLGPWGTTGCCVVRLQSPQRWKGWQRVSPQGSTGDRRRKRMAEWKDRKNREIDKTVWTKEEL